MSASVVALSLIPVALLALAWGCYWKSRFHGAKAEVYQEFADTYRGMLIENMYGRPKEERRAVSKRNHMRLALVDSRVRDGLADALEASESDWGRYSGDEPRDWRIVRAGVRS